MDILTLAQQWHVPPWVIEEECTPLWWARWRAWEDELASARKEKAEKKAGA